jgi:hypothetical protein
MAIVAFKLCTKGLATAPVAMFRALANWLGRVGRLIEAPNTYRPERHYMRGTGPKSRANREGGSRQE